MVSLRRCGWFFSFFLLPNFREFLSCSVRNIIGIPGGVSAVSLGVSVVFSWCLLSSTVWLVFLILSTSNFREFLSCSVRNVIGIPGGVSAVSGGASAVPGGVSTVSGGASAVPRGASAVPLGA